jgi:SAM-dependent methyltransferase
MNFKDNFSAQSDLYVRYRPHYPSELYDFLASLTPQHELAWDCGTGNGQAAIGLAPYYKQVIATDPSPQQIANAFPNGKVTYRVEQGELNSLASASADIITLANALHWMDFEAFYKEVLRVLKPGGLIAAWAYPTPTVSPEIDALTKRLHDEILGDYWLRENRYVENAYTDIPFPFELIEAPGFSCTKLITLDDFMGFLNTWSATQRFLRQNRFNPADEIYAGLIQAWGDPADEKKVTWELVLKVGKPGTEKN